LSPAKTAAFQLSSGSKANVDAISEAFFAWAVCEAVCANTPSPAQRKKATIQARRIGFIAPRIRCKNVILSYQIECVQFSIFEKNETKKLPAQKAGGRYEGKPFNANMVL